MKRPGIFYKAITSLQYVDDKDPEFRAVIRVLKAAERAVIIDGGERESALYLFPESDNRLLAKAILAARRAYEWGKGK